MPLLSSSSYHLPWGMANGHLQTIFPALFRRVPLVTRERERIETPDGDFLDLDWNQEASSSRLAILSHGLEGGSRNAYMQGMAAALRRAGWRRDGLWAASQSVPCGPIGVDGATHREAAAQLTLGI